MITLANKIRDSFLSVFPKSLCKAGQGSCFPSPNFYLISLRLVPNAYKLPSNISQNDPLHSVFSIELLPNGKVQAKVVTGGVFTVKPTNPLYALDHLELGWRNKTGTEAQILVHFIKFFTNAKLTILANEANFYGSAEQVQIYKDHLA
jgi:hypothetical protein